MTVTGAESTPTPVALLPLPFGSVFFTLVGEMVDPVTTQGGGDVVVVTGGKVLVVEGGGKSVVVVGPAAIVVVVVLVDVLGAVVGKATPLVVGNDSAGFFGAASIETTCPSRFVTENVTSVTLPPVRTTSTSAGAWPCTHPAGRGGSGLETLWTLLLVNGSAPGVPEQVTRLIR